MICTQTISSFIHAYDQFTINCNLLAALFHLLGGVSCGEDWPIHWWLVMNWGCIWLLRVAQPPNLQILDNWPIRNMWGGECTVCQPQNGIEKSVPSLSFHSILRLINYPLYTQVSFKQIYWIFIWILQLWTGCTMNIPKNVSILNSLSKTAPRWLTSLFENRGCEMIKCNKPDSKNNTEDYATISKPNILVKVRGLHDLSLLHYPLIPCALAFVRSEVKANDDSCRLLIKVSIIL